MGLNRKGKIRALRERVKAGRFDQSLVLRLVEVLAQAEKIAIPDGVDRHDRLMEAMDAALKEP